MIARTLMLIWLLLMITNSYSAYRVFFADVFSMPYHYIEKELLVFGYINSDESNLYLYFSEDYANASLNGPMGRILIESGSFSLKNIYEICRNGYVSIRGVFKYNEETYSIQLTDSPSKFDGNPGGVCADKDVKFE